LSVPANEYSFLTQWSVSGSPDDVYSVLSDAAALPRWWPAVYLDARVIEPGGEKGIGRVIALHTKGFLPYTLRWRFRVTEALRPERLALEAQGDFVGTGVWTIRAAASGSQVSFEWTIRAEKPLLRWFSPLLKPAFAANHRWAMDRGRESLELELQRRRAVTEAERAAVPSPPGPTWPHRRCPRPGMDSR
jgi:hypothetical protein